MEQGRSIDYMTFIKRHIALWLTASLFDTAANIICAWGEGKIDVISKRRYFDWVDIVVTQSKIPSSHIAHFPSSWWESTKKSLFHCCIIRTRFPEDYSNFSGFLKSESWRCTACKTSNALVLLPLWHHWNLFANKTLPTLVECTPPHSGTKLFLKASSRCKTFNHFSLVIWNKKKKSMMQLVTNCSETFFVTKKHLWIFQYYIHCFWTIWYSNYTCPMYDSITVYYDLHFQL